MVIFGFTAYDGMCRPTVSNDFVFVDGKFAGTTSPEVMFVRSDGSSGSLKFDSNTEFTGEFECYEESYPLCCPVDSAVTYRIDTIEDAPVVVPVAAKREDSPPK